MRTARTWVPLLASVVVLLSAATALAEDISGFIATTRTIQREQSVGRRRHLYRHGRAMYSRSARRISTSG